MRRLLFLIALLPSAALADDPRTACATACKVITLSAEEERVLVGPNMVFDTAVQGRQIDLSGVVAYFRNKLATAPAGDVTKPLPVAPGSGGGTPAESSVQK